MTAVPTDTALEDVRREIDDIDAGLLDLLAKRIAASARVRQVKTRSGTLASSPIRPAREALILRRLMALKPPDVTPDLLVRLWRVILTSSTLAQAPVTAHVSESLDVSGRLRTLVGDHFCATPVIVHPDEISVLANVATHPGDVGAVASGSDWAMQFSAGLTGTASIMAVLPVLKDSAEPELLVVGHAAAQPTGDDETIVILDEPMPQIGALPVRWSVRSGAKHVAGLEGFLSENDGVLAELMRSHATLGLRVAGRYPSPIEVKP
jgi:chorismate mutase